MEDVARSENKSHQVVSWVLIAGLLLLRIPMLGGISSFSQPGWLHPSYELGTYLLTALLIWWERKRLSDFYIDTLALGIIIAFKPIETIILAIWGFREHPFAVPNPFSLVFWIIALGLALTLWLSRTPLPKLSRVSWHWFGIGILAGLATALVTAYPMSFQVDAGSLPPKAHIAGLLAQAPLSFLYQLGYAAVSEEPLFRGFLWGSLEKLGWKSVWIWLVQVGLFMLAHIYYLKLAPVSFWFIVPVGALVLGALVWRSKTLASSLAAHATMNALGRSLEVIVAVFSM